MGMQALEGLVQRRKGGPRSEQGVEAHLQTRNRLWIRLALVGLEVGIESHIFAAHPCQILTMADH